MKTLEYDILTSSNNFKWHKRMLDAIAKYEYKHIGEPEKYPCGVISKWEDNQNGPYEYHHEFVYIQETTCPECGHKILAWPALPE